MTTDIDKHIGELEQFIKDTRKEDYSNSYLIAVLHKAQELYGYLPEKVLDVIAEKMGIPTARIWGVATFYHYFNLRPIGKFVISVCMGTACYVKGADEVLTAIMEHLGLKAGQTTKDKLFTLNEARCLGACGLAPVIMINDKIYGKLDRKSTVELLETIKKTGKLQ
jgi:NADH:ubiquinone oxidoreductase subunit E